MGIILRNNYFMRLDNSICMDNKRVITDLQSHRLFTDFYH